MSDSVEKVANAVESVINGIVPGAACDGDWLVTEGGIRLSIRGIAIQSAEAAIDALVDVMPNPCGNSDCLANCAVCVKFFDAFGQGGEW